MTRRRLVGLVVALLILCASLTIDTLKVPRDQLCYGTSQWSRCDPPDYRWETSLLVCAAVSATVCVWLGAGLLRQRIIRRKEPLRARVRKRIPW
jgi:hypothetical protein